MDRMSAPKLSVGMPVYNGENYLVQAFESILAQDFEDFELIVSDNASSDNTEAICRRYAERDSRIRYYRSETNLGGTRNHNRVFELARGTYFKWAAHDDVCLPGFFRRCVEVFDQVPETVVLVYPRTQMIDDDGRLLDWYAECLDSRQPRPHQRLAHVLRQFNVPSAQYGLIRSAALRKTRRLSNVIASDLLLLSELVTLGEFREVPEILFHRRIHAGMSTKALRSWRQLLTWSNPSGTGYSLPISPKVRLGYQFIGSISQLPLNPVDKWLCYLTAPSLWYFREFRNWGGRHKLQLKARLGFNAAK
jgi:glycosyltransferase involved in cell wall biosynthesis